MKAFLEDQHADQIERGGRIDLPCGNVGYRFPGETGYVCQGCLCVYGSLACPCTDKPHRQEDSHER